jgi:hypothetical protein
MPSHGKDSAVLLVRYRDFHVTNGHDVGMRCNMPYIYPRQYERSEMTSLQCHRAPYPQRLGNHLHALQPTNTFSRDAPPQGRGIFWMYSVLQGRE